VDSGISYESPDSPTLPQVENFHGDVKRIRQKRRLSVNM
jgi:hypothetical protein